MLPVTGASTGPALAESDLPTLLLVWYDTHRRAMPWRALPGIAPDPYAVWLSEIMLQQTTVATVVGYFERFLARWPTVRALASAPLDDVLHAWAGLGYYARARNLHACAKAICARHDGQFPDDEARLLTLPGIGAYSAASIAAIAFDRPANVVDGNVERVMARLFRVEAPLPAAKSILRTHAARLAPAHRPGDYAQGLMDLGATICTPRKPRCLLCPWRQACGAFAQGDPERFPLKTAKPARPHRHAVAFYVEAPDGRILLRRRVESGLLGGMIEIPTTPWQGDPWEPGDAIRHCPISARSFQKIDGHITHVFTHFSLDVAVFSIRLSETPPMTDGLIWADGPAIKQLALPSLMKKIRAYAEKSLAVRDPS